MDLPEQQLLIVQHEQRAVASWAKAAGSSKWRLPGDETYPVKIGSVPMSFDSLMGYFSSPAVPGRPASSVPGRPDVWTAVWIILGQITG